MPHPQVDNRPQAVPASWLNLLGAMNFLSILVNNFSLRFRSEINPSPPCKSASEHADLGERGRDTGPRTAAVRLSCWIPCRHLSGASPARRTTWNGSIIACHSGFGMHTPVDVHHQRAEDVRVARNQVLTYADADY